MSDWLMILLDLTDFVAVYNFRNIFWKKHATFSLLSLLLGEFRNVLLVSSLFKSTGKGGNLDCTSRVICVCWYQISRFFNFGGYFYYSNFSSWSNESALSFFDFALFHGQNQVLSLFVTFRHFFNNNLDCTSRVICACWYQILSFESWKWPPVFFDLFFAVF